MNPEIIAGNQGAWGDFYRSRQRITTLLLIFVVGVGLPLITIQPLRQRLSERVEALREAYGGRLHTIARAIVGENMESFPAEYALPEPPLPQLPQIAPASPGIKETPSARSSPGVRTLRIPAPPAEQAASAPEPHRVESSVAMEPAASEETDQPRYQQGVAEKEAYELLLKLSAAMDRLVQGADPALRYESWGAMKRGDAVYWVRVTFFSAADENKIEYIWQVDLQSRSATPLSFNARALARS